MKIGKPELVEQDGAVRIQSLVEYAGQKEYLWYSVDKKYGDYLTTEKLDGFVVGLLFLAMKHGETIYVDGAISEKLFYNLTRYIHILSIMNPSLRPVKIVPTSLDDGTSYPCAGAVMTGFSGGIDSFCVLADHLLGSPPPSYKITHLIFNNVGAHGDEASHATRVFHDRYRHIEGVAEDLGIPLVKVDSNITDILKVDFMMTVQPRNISAILQLQKLCGRFYYASTYRYQDCHIKATRMWARSDPVAIHLLSTETLDCVSAGCEYSRVEKLIRVADVELARRYLSVCASDNGEGTNCSTCFKCRRTLVTLDILGKLDLFAGVFDVDYYRRHRSAYMMAILIKGEPAFRDHDKEMLEHARTVGFRFPLRCRVGAFFLKALPRGLLQRVWHGQR